MKMKMVTILTNIFNQPKLNLILISLAIIIVSPINCEPDRHCLDCICRASTGCKANVQCHNDGAGGYFCGPYQISWAYWADAGKPGDAGFPNDFETCLVKKSCAEAAVRGYMQKWATDCNGDGHVDCLDYAAIHKTGPVKSCQPNWLLDSKYWSEFQKCYQSSSSTSETSIDNSFSRDTLSTNQPSTTTNSELIEIPRPTRTLRPRPEAAIASNSPRRRPSQPPFLEPPPPLPPLPQLPPVVAHATASVPGISASASASAGFDHGGEPITFASASTNDNENGLLEIANFSPNRLPSNNRQSGSRSFRPNHHNHNNHNNYNNHHNNDNVHPPLPGPFNKPLSSAIFVPSSNYKPVPTRIVFPGPSSPSLPPPLPPPPPITNNNHNDRNNYNHDSNDVVVTSHAINVPKPQPIIDEPIVNVVEHSAFTSSSPSGSGPNSATPLVPYDCLHCLCHASSKCDLTKGCDGAYCGPYLLSWGYWADGGQPGNEYAQCSKQKRCSEIAIQGYMEKWKRDCNNDGIIDCTDFALIHKLGPHGCGQIQALEASDYWRQFNECSVTNKPARSTRPTLVEIPQPAYTNRGPNTNERITRPVRPAQPPPPPRAQPRNDIEEVNEDDDFTIRVNNRELINGPNRDPFEEPARTRIDLSHFNRSRPIIIRIKPPADGSNINDNNNNFRPITIQPAQPVPAPRPSPQPQPRPQPRPVIIDHSDEPVFNEQPRPRPRPIEPNNNNNDNFFNQPRPFENGPNDRPNVFEIPRRQPSDEDSRSQPIIQPQPQPRPQPPPPQPSTTNRPSRPQNTTITSEMVSQECLECLCYASSKCSTSIGCRSEGTGKYICGPYQVDWEYWAEAGKPGNRADLSNLENFQMCLNNRDCADRTVREYMARWKKDCNEDGHIDCNDFAAIHVAGPNQCNAQWYLDSKYYSDFRECFDF